MTPLSRVITSFHPIERHSIHPLCADPNSVRQAGQRIWLDKGTGGRRQRGRWGRRDGRYGDKAAGRKEGEGGGRGRGGGQLRCTSLSSLCPDSCEILEEEKSRPPATLTSRLPPPTSMLLFLGHLWARGVGRGTVCTLTYCHIQLQSKLCVMALKEIFLPSFIKKKIWNQRGGLFDSCKGSPSLPF